MGLESENVLRMMVRSQTHTNTHTHTHTRARTHACAYARTHARTHIHIHTHTYYLSFQSFFVLNNEILNYSTRYSNNVHINSCATQVIMVPKYGMRFHLKFVTRHPFMCLKRNLNCIFLILT